MWRVSDPQDRRLNRVMERRGVRMMRTALARGSRSTRARQISPEPPARVRPGASWGPLRERAARAMAAPAPDYSADPGRAHGRLHGGLRAPRRASNPGAHVCWVCSTRARGLTSLHPACISTDMPGLETRPPPIRQVVTAGRPPASPRAWTSGARCGSRARPWPAPSSAPPAPPASGPSSRRCRSGSAAASDSAASSPE